LAKKGFGKRIKNRVNGSSKGYLKVIIEKMDYVSNYSQVIFIIPAYNEEENLQVLLPELSKFMRFFGYKFHIIVVNDGSNDNTGGVVKRLQTEIPLTLLNHETNYGPGAAFRTGFKKALAIADDCNLIVTMEADNTGDFYVLHKMLERCRKDSDLVLASVYGTGRVLGAPLHRRFFSHCANILLKIIFRVKGINTFTSFFRVYRATMLREAFKVYGNGLIEESGFVCMLELLIKLHALKKYKITQVPMLLDFKMRIGDSKMKTWLNIRDTLRVIYKYKFNNKRAFSNIRVNNLANSTENLKLPHQRR